MLPEMSVMHLEVGTLPTTGWKSQLPEERGWIKIEKYYISRITITYYPIGGNCFYKASFSSTLSPNLRPFYKFMGTAV